MSVKPCDEFYVDMVGHRRNGTRKNDAAERSEPNRNGAHAARSSTSYSTLGMLLVFVTVVT